MIRLNNITIILEHLHTGTNFWGRLSAILFASEWPVVCIVFIKPNQNSLFNRSSQSLSFLQVCTERLWGRDWPQYVKSVQRFSMHGFVGWFLCPRWWQFPHTFFPVPIGAFSWLITCIDSILKSISLSSSFSFWTCSLSLTSFCKARNTFFEELMSNLNEHFCARAWRRSAPTATSSKFIKLKAQSPYLPRSVQRFRFSLELVIRCCSRFCNKWELFSQNTRLMWQKCFACLKATLHWTWYSAGPRVQALI